MSRRRSAVLDPAEEAAREAAHAAVHPVLTRACSTCGTACGTAPSVSVVDPRGNGEQVAWSRCPECQRAPRSLLVLRVLGIKPDDHALLAAARVPLPNYSDRWASRPDRPASAAFAHVDRNLLLDAYRVEHARIARMKLSPPCAWCGTRFHEGGSTTHKGGANTCHSCNERNDQARFGGVSVFDLAASVLAGLSTATGVMLVRGLAAQVGLDAFFDAAVRDRLDYDGTPTPWGWVDVAALRQKVLALGEARTLRIPKTGLAAPGSIRW
jgi:hypothetical protein